MIRHLLLTVAIVFCLVGVAQASDTPLQAEARQEEAEAHRLFAAGDYRQAQPHFARLIDLHRKLSGSAYPGDMLFYGNCCFSLGQFASAIAAYQEGLGVARAIRDLPSQILFLDQMGICYQWLGQFEKARQSYVASLALAAPNSTLRAATLRGMAMCLMNCDRSKEGLDYIGQALCLSLQDTDKSSASLDYRLRGYLYHELHDYTAEIASYQDALRFAREAHDAGSEAETLTHLGTAYQDTGRFKEALEAQRGAIDLAGHVGRASTEEKALGNLGRLYLSQRDFEHAISCLERALVMGRALSDPAREVRDLYWLVLAWNERGNNQMAIFYGKQAVNVMGQMRKDLRSLDKEEQKLFLDINDWGYRNLASLLVAEGRLGEAQQIMDLMKQQEYDMFVRGDPQTMQSHAYQTPLEQKWEQDYRTLSDRLGSIGLQRDQLLAKPSLSADDQKRLESLERDLELANQQFQQFLGQLARDFGGKRDERLSQIKESQAFKADLREMGNGVVALYTVVTPDKYRVILTTPDFETAGEYTISRAHLNEKIFALRQALQNPRKDARAAAHELYQIMLGPVAHQLQQCQARTLMWSLDENLRYVPLAALYDGSHYLVEGYRNVVFTPASNTRLKDAPNPSWKVLGLGVSKKIGDFSPLPSVAEEMKAVVSVLPGTVKMDEAFSEKAMREALRQRYPVVHIASHFNFSPGDEKNSYLLLGDGSHLDLAQVKSWPTVFEGVDLLTLSACNTAMGDSGSDGNEVEGFGVLAQRQGAKAILATLWPVADDSTRLLMQNFYGARASDPAITKAEALRRAQLSLLQAADGHFSHPFYWAPFILIGNWK